MPILIVLILLAGAYVLAMACRRGHKDLPASGAGPMLIGVSTAAAFPKTAWLPSGWRWNMATASSWTCI